jgi:dihydroorotate dehydrogenase electron transfer subunit
VVLADEVKFDFRFIALGYHALHMVSAKESPEFVQTRAWIVHHEAVSSRYYLLRLRCEQIAKNAQPGQFVMLSCSPDIAGMSLPLLPRPLAILDARKDQIELLYFVAGSGTETLRRCATSTVTCKESTSVTVFSEDDDESSLRIIGPLGKGFTPIPGVDAHVAIGGGSGVAPLVFFLRRYASRSPISSGVLHTTVFKKSDPPSGVVPREGSKAQAWHLILAARNAAQLAREDVVKIPGALHVATDDGSSGFRGNAVQALESLLNGELKGVRTGLYAAGPEPMMEGVAKIGSKLGLPVRVSLEGRMGCGVGVCRACVVDGLSPHPKTGLKRRTVCQDGPVFDAKELAGWASL